MTSPHTGQPQRALIVSAAMGEGHNAAADAIAEAIAECWPGCLVERQDTMELRGPAFAQYTQRAYSKQLVTVPWTYEVSYDGLARSRAAASAAKWAVGTFFGPPLGRVLAAKRPDLVISTYPFASAGLNWLRARKGLDLLTVTYIPAFHVHPMWAYPGVDLHFVMYDSAAADARTAGFERSMRLGAPTVKSGFGSATRGAARAALGLPMEDFVVLMTGGAWGLGGIAAGVEALVSLGHPVRVVAVCGHNRSLRDQLGSLAALHPDRLVVLGYVSNMPELMAAADLVVTNGAGNTVLESLRTPRPVVAFSPLAGHGTASTAEMTRRGLAVAAPDVAALAQQVKRLSSQRELLADMEASASAWAAGRDLRSSLDEIETLWRQRHGPRVRLPQG